ncbi:hypothetical protein [Vreelandella sp. GE22]
MTEDVHGRIWRFSVISNEEVQMIEQSMLFDGEWYAERYPDVKSSHIDPATHYCKYGWKMLRDPSEKFSTAGYLNKHKDIKKKKVNPLFHYLQFGREEGRGIVASFHSEGLRNIKVRKTSAEPATLSRQLAETQFLLEKYYIRCQELEHQKLGQKTKSESL